MVVRKTVKPSQPLYLYLPKYKTKRNIQTKTGRITYWNSHLLLVSLKNNYKILQAA